MTKTYDRAYFNRWYRSADRVVIPGEVQRKAALAVALAEYFLRRPLRDVLDVGCGEGAWYPHLRKLRPRVKYTGVDPSEYVVRRFGRTRNIRQASFGGLSSLRLDGPYDLVVCSDVLHYVPDAEIRAGVDELVRVAGGVVFIDVLTAEDDIVGDLDGLTQRPAAWYRKLFSASKLVPAGPYAWLSPALRDVVSELERCR